MLSKPPLSQGKAAELEVDQADALRAVAKQLSLSQVDLAARMGTPWPTLRKWLLPAGSQNRREMSPTARRLLDEIVVNHDLAHQNATLRRELLRLAVELQKHTSS